MLGEIGRQNIIPQYYQYLLSSQQAVRELPKMNPCYCDNI